MKEELGKISNLIATMTVRGATPDEIQRAVDYSIEVVRCLKAKRNYNIEDLERKYEVEEEEYYD